MTATKTDFKETRVLLADDDFMVAQGIARQLRISGYEVVGTARDGLEAVAMASDLKPDVILLDLDMPNLGGVAAAQRILEVEPKPIVIVTAYHSANLVKECRRAGAGAFLVKPVNRRQLQGAIEAARALFVARVSTTS